MASLLADVARFVRFQWVLFSFALCDIFFFSLLLFKMFFFFLFYALTLCASNLYLAVLFLFVSYPGVTVWTIMSSLFSVWLLTATLAPGVEIQGLSQEMLCSWPSLIFVILTVWRHVILLNVLVCYHLFVLLLCPNGNVSIASHYCNGGKTLLILI